MLFKSSVNGKIEMLVSFFIFEIGDIMLAIGFIILAICLVFGGTFVLLRTAKKPRIPKNFKPRDCDEDDSSGW